MSIKKTVMGGILGVTTLLGAGVAQAEEVKFNDVPKGHWSEKAIDQLAKDNIFKGYGNGQFGFGDNITRGQVASLVNRYLKLEVEDEQKKMFSDSKNHMFEKDIEAVGQAGIMGGDGSGEFRPDDVLTRYEMAVVLRNAFELHADVINRDKHGFTDVPKEHWAAAYVKALADAGVSKGDGAGNFMGDDVVKREQYAQFLHNAMEVKKEENQGGTGGEVKPPVVDPGENKDKKDVPEVYVDAKLGKFADDLKSEGYKKVTGDKGITYYEKGNLAVYVSKDQDSFVQFIYKGDNNKEELVSNLDNLLGKLQKQGFEFDMGKTKEYVMSMLNGSDEVHLQDEHVRVYKRSGNGVVVLFKK
ncbi:S-layer homology domain-containing protein [Bacillus sp. JJ1127]